MTRAGRKRKLDVERYENGTIVRAERGERPEQIMAVVKAQPHRRWLPEADKHTQLAESPIGRLRLVGEISQRQYSAAEMFRGKALAYFRCVVGQSMTSPRSPDMEIGGGTSCAVEPDGEMIAAIKDNWTAMMLAVSDCGLFPRVGLLTRVIIRERDCAGYEVSELRAMLNALANLWKLPRPDDWP